METCGQQEKVESNPQVLLEIFLQIQNFFWRYAKLNRFWVGWTKIPILWARPAGTEPELYKIQMCSPNLTMQGSFQWVCSWGRLVYCEFWNTSGKYITCRIGREHIATASITRSVIVSSTCPIWFCMSGNMHIAHHQLLKIIIRKT